MGIEPTTNRAYSVYRRVPLRHDLHQLHAVFRTQSGRQREPSIKTHRSPLSAEFWRIACWVAELNAALYLDTTERANENINVSKYFISSSGDRTHNQSILQSHFVPLSHDYPQYRLLYWNSEMGCQIITLYRKTVKLTETVNITVKYLFVR